MDDQQELSGYVDVWWQAVNDFVELMESVPEAEWDTPTDLDGWDVKISGHDLNDNFANTFRVEDGLLKVRYDGYDSFNNQFGHMFYREPFSRYVVAVEYRFVGEQARGGPDWALRNSGVMIHSQSAKSMAKDQDFPISIEVQLLGGNGTGERSTANLCTPGTNVVMNGRIETRHCISSASKTFHGEEWVREIGRASCRERVSFLV